MNSRFFKRSVFVLYFVVLSAYSAKPIFTEELFNGIPISEIKEWSDLCGVDFPMVMSIVRYISDNGPYWKSDGVAPFLTPRFHINGFVRAIWEATGIDANSSLSVLTNTLENLQDEYPSIKKNLGLYFLFADTAFDIDFDDPDVKLYLSSYAPR